MLATRLKLTALCLAGLLMPTGSASAQVVYEPTFDPEQFYFSADPYSISLLDSARPLSKMEFGVGLAFHLGGAPLTTCSRRLNGDGCLEGTSGDIVSSRFTSHLVGAFGFGRFDARVSMPVVLNQGSDFDPAPGSDALAGAGVGDPLFGARVLIAQIKDISLAGDIGFTIPLTNASNFIGNSSVVVHPRILADWRRGRLSAVAAVGYRWRVDDTQVANLYIGDEFTWSAGGEVQITPKKLSAGLTIFGALGVQEDPNPMFGVGASPSGEERPVEALVNGRYWVTPKIAVETAVGTGLTSGYGSADYRLLAGVRYVDRREDDPEPVVVERAKDTDGDGIFDDKDKCPNEKEDMDGFEDEDGCPDPDNDADGILDATDKCPMKPEDKNGFEDEDGCPDGDNDKDGDGIADNVDKCPEKPEDKDGFQDEDGCPDLDNDGDGIPDGSDKCKDKPEDIDKFQDEDGCPDPDNDGDGFPDTKDKCPDKAEIFNGVDDDDGCPDQGNTIATVTATNIQILQKVFFRFNSAKIRRRSHKILDVVAAVMKAHAALNIRVEGHTDDVGGEAFNLSLSQRRADSVKAYLVKKGIDAARLTPQGFGETKPLVEGRGRRARAKNRRVEFVIIK